MNGYCELYIFKNCKILKGKNFKVESIRNYLKTLDTLNKKDASTGNPIAITGQWMKHGLKLEYAIDFKDTTQENYKYKQALSCLYEAWSNYNYLLAQNVDTGTQAGVPTKLHTSNVFYFITNIKWNGENSVKLELEMDVINTMIDNYPPNTTPLTLSPKTFILRQHKDRWEVGSYEMAYIPKVDFYSEGINTPLLKKKENTLYATYSSDFNLDYQSYYLIYLASEEGNNKPIDIYLTSDEAMTIKQAWTYWSGTFNARGELGSKYGAIIYGNDGASSLTNVGCNIKFKDADGQVRTFTITSSNQAIVIRNNLITWGIIDSNGFTNTSGVLNVPARQARKIEITGLARMRVCDRDVVKALFDIPTLTDAYILNLPYATEYAPSSLGDVDVLAITEVDRSQGSIAKIVKLPYCPIGIVKGTDGKYVLPADWEVSTFPLLAPAGVKSVHYRFQNAPDAFTTEFYVNTTGIDLQEPFGVMGERKISALAKGLKVVKNSQYETKLLHSDFFIQKLVYDSFGYNFRCEMMDIGAGAMNLKIKMATTTSMTSNFFFEFPDNLLKFDTEDYSNLMMVSRNNEVVLYNSSYLDYIRNGYNFDKKTRNRNLALSIASLGLGVVGDVAGIVAGSGEKTKGESIAGAVQFGAKTLNSTFKIIGQTAQADQNIAQKLRTSLYQGVAVAGSDELDLLSEYAVDNKPKMVVYEVSDKMKQCLFDLFYYTGYVANIQGVPDTTSRKWFNFVQAEIVLDNEQGFPQEFLDELRNKYVEGITYLHKNERYENEVLIKEWDFEQQYENWETSMIGTPSINPVPQTSALLKDVEYVIKSNLTASRTAYLLNDGKLTWRKRRKSDLVIIDEISELDEFRISNLSISQPKMSVRQGSTSIKSINFVDYADADFYWTIEFSANTSYGVHPEDVYSTIMGYIEYN